MNACPECGGELFFDIKSQSLLCPYCSGKKAPGRFSDFGPAADEATARSGKNDEISVTLYSCPQCGGSIYSTEQSINGFCSYCGSYVMLESRMAKMKYPKYVAPFRIDKEHCKQLYLDHVKRALLAPKELKDPEYLDRFRGIYISYWGYDVSLNGYLALEGERPGYAGGTEKVRCKGWLHAVYTGAFFDASSSFEDHFSEQIAPFDHNALVEFTPAYLTGFYADLPDLDDSVYEDNAIFIAKERVLSSSRLQKAFPSVHFSEAQKELFRPTIDAHCSETYTTLFPVWFLSYRNKDRVAYAVINGQNGRMVSDLPVDRKKFCLLALLIALPLFGFLCLQPAIPPTALFLISECLSLSSVFMLTQMLKRIFVQREKIYDKGYQSKNRKLNYLYYLKETSDIRSIRQKGLALLPYLLVAAVMIFLPRINLVLAALFNGFTLELTSILSIVIEIFLFRSSFLIAKIVEQQKVPLLAGIWITFAGTLYGTYLTLMTEAGAAQMLLCVCVILIGTLISQMITLDQYNIMVTRPLPQLKRKGGADHAWD
ncbi:MAG: hypothetical protein K6E50_15870 [Lachnospiraceae bacterium]|nr:hypothetical protein [Lachnospiraceae bacterium]